MVLRALELTGEPQTWLLSCIRAALKESAERGYKAWIMPMTFENSTCHRVYRLLKRFSIVEGAPTKMVMVGGKISCLQQ